MFLTDNPPWLSELITLSPDKYTFVNPPLPGVLLVPFVAAFGTSFPQQLLAHLLGAGAVAAAFKLALYITKSSSKALWVALALGLGSIAWFLSSVGSVWYLGLVSGALFTLIALFESYKEKVSGFRVGFAVTLACLSRTQLFLTIPYFLFLVWRKANSKKETAFYMASASAGILISFGYNWVRFGSPTEFGHALIPGLIDEPWFREGLFSLSYIPNHLKIFFAALPVFKNEFPFVFPTIWGHAIWLTSPVFAYVLRASLKTLEVKLTWLVILVIALLNFSYGSTGFSQFGYRYAVDFYPFLVLLLCLHLKNKKLTKLHWILLLISILVNTWGVVFINKLGWVG